jgi:PAS domain-containing protein
MRAGKKLKASPAGSKTPENVLQDSERRFRAIFNNTFQFIGLLRPDGSILEINDTALEFVGLKLDEIRGRFFWDTDGWSLSPETQSQLKTAVEQAVCSLCSGYPGQEWPGDDD